MPKYHTEILEIKLYIFLFSYEIACKKTYDIVRLVLPIYRYLFLTLQILRSAKQIVLDTAWVILLYNPSHQFFLEIYEKILHKLFCFSKECTLSRLLLVKMKNSVSWKSLFKRCKKEEADSINFKKEATWSFPRIAIFTNSPGL